MKYKFIDHTADVAFEVYGKNLRELFENATMAFYDAFVNVERLEEDKHVEIEVEADGVDYLLFKWLNELLYLFDTEFFGGKRCSINVSENKAKGKIIGGKLTAEIIKVEPKAITLHNFKVEKRDGDWYAFVVIDI
ncbi:MAG: archease [Archaeoglobaceae archaeon]|nr:archease [Archaeoglobaceae archaeon]HDD36421.1 archease [Archaeoglobus veneficus]